MIAELLNKWTDGRSDAQKIEVLEAILSHVLIGDDSQQEYADFYYTQTLSRYPHLRKDKAKHDKVAPSVPS